VSGRRASCEPSDCWIILTSSSIWRCRPHGRPSGNRDLNCPGSADERANRGPRSVHHWPGSRTSIRPVVVGPRATQRRPSRLRATAAKVTAAAERTWARPLQHADKEHLTSRLDLYRRPSSRLTGEWQGLYSRRRRSPARRPSSGPLGPGPLSIGFSPDAEFAELRGRAQDF
jgi:hypothetical protein